MKQPGLTSTSILGNPVLRREDATLIRGQGEYVGNQIIEGALHCHFARSTVAHGEILSIETSEAESMPGVVAVYTTQNLGLADREGAMDFYASEMTRPYLARDKVRFVGEPIAVVVAETAYQAADAAESIWADIEPLDSVIDLNDSLEAKTVLFDGMENNICWEKEIEDPIDFSQYEVVISQDLVNSRVAPVSIEPRVAAATWENDRLIYWASSQGTHDFRDEVISALEIEKEDIRVFVKDIGGGFGAKGFASEEEIIIAQLARLLKKPVRWTESRTENLTGYVHGRAQNQKVKMAGTSDGRIKAFRLEILQDCGAYPKWGPYLPEFTRQLACGVYDIERVECEFKSLMTNTAPTCAYRGAGRPEATAAIERAVDLFAAEIGMDPAEVRRINFIPPEAFPFTTATGTLYDSGDYEKALDAALKAADYEGLRAEQEQRRQEKNTKQLGIGVATYVEITGFGGSEYGHVSLRPDGTVLATTGATPIGTGHFTTWAMIVAEKLGIPMEKIEVFHGDTDIVPTGETTGGSRSVQLAGSAMADASDKLIEIARQKAADLLEASPEDIVLDTDKGEFHVAGTPSISHSWADIAESTEDPLAGLSDFSQEGATFPFGTHIAVAEVDLETGKSTIQRIIAVDDSGKIMNPLLAAGQIHGGLAQGVAQALLEEFKYDSDGNPQTTNLADYTAISTTELPLYERSFTETLSPSNPLGAKGIGESGSIGSTAAVQSAIVDALSPQGCLLYTSPSPRDRQKSRMPSSA